MISNVLTPYICVRNGQVSWTTAGLTNKRENKGNNFDE